MFGKVFYTGEITEKPVTKCDGLKRLGNIQSEASVILFFCGIGCGLSGSVCGWA